MVDATLPLERTARDPRQARAFVQERLVGVPADICGDAMLLVSELVTNAVRHGASPARLEVTVGATTLRVGVVDSAAAMPSQRVSRPEEATGRGLMIVAAIAAAWGVEATGQVGGKRVWFELPLTR